MGVPLTQLNRTELLIREASLTHALRGASYRERQLLRGEIAKCRKLMQPWRDNKYPARPMGVTLPQRGRMV